MINKKFVLIEVGLLLLAFLFAGWWGIVGYLLVLAIRALYRLYKMREYLLIMFNYGWSLLRPNKFKPYYPEGDIKISDLLGKRRDEK